MIETVAALSAVLGAIVLLRFVLIRLGFDASRPRRSGRIQVMETTSLGAKLQLHLVEVEGHRLLLGSSDTGIRRLERLSEPSAAREAGEISETAPERSDAAGTTRSRLRAMNVVGGWLGIALFIGIAIGSIGAGEAAAQALAPAPGGGPPTTSTPTLTLSIDGATDPDRISDTMQIVLVLTALSVAPSILLMATCFTRILIVLALLRQAIGTPTLPPTQVLVGLSLMTTLYVMSPVAEVVYEDALQPYVAREIGGQEAIQRGIGPVRSYLLAHTREKDLRLFLDMKEQAIPETPEEIGLPALMPAFMISEIRTAFEIGFMVYLPFLVVDLVIASMLISLGMIMLPPVMIALPFKLMLFVLVDGWNLTLSALVSGLQ